MTRPLALLALALGIALGVVAALWLVFWRSGAEPETEYEPVPRAESQTVCARCGHAMHWRSCDTLVLVPGGMGVCLCRNDIAEYDGEPVGV